jgi:hypothetical protein
LAFASLGAMLAVVVWGALSFGAVYPWAYQSLAIAAAIVGVAGLLLGRKNRPPLVVLAAAMVLLALAIGIQLVPLSRETLQRISPATINFLVRYDFSYVVSGAAHPISIAPAKTQLGLSLFGAFAIFLLGGTKLVSRFGAQRLAVALITFGALLAVFGIVQEVVNLSNKIVLVYGFWKPQYLGSRPFGPFINRNHFAGWMLMAVPLVLGLFCSGTARAMLRVRPTLRDRVLWFSSPEANQTLLVAAAACVMALSLVLTMSRSGIAAGVLTTVMIMAVALWKQRSMTRKLVAAVTVGLICVTAITWTGTDVIARRFVNTNWAEFNDRRGAWLDALAISRRFLLTGTGFNTYGTATLFYQEHNLDEHFAQAHNDYLQLLAEGGLLMTVPAVLVVVGFFVVVRRRLVQEASVTGFWLRAGALAGVAAIALQETVDFSLQMPGNAVLFTVLCAVAIHRYPGTTNSSPPPPSRSSP